MGMKELTALIAGPLGRRCSERDKTQFLRYLSARLEETESRVQLDARRSRSRKPCRNVVVGNLKQAAVVLAVPYDTGTRMDLPGAVYAPADPAHNYRLELANLFLHTLFGLGILCLYFWLVLKRFFPGGGIPEQLLTVLGMAVTAAISLRIMGGWPNRKNYNRNSSCIVLLLEGLARKIWGKKTALAFLDRSCCSVEGGKQLADQMAELHSQAIVLLLDSLCQGDTLFLHYPAEMEQQAQQVAQLLRKRFTVRLHQLSETRVASTVISCFPRALMLTGGQEENGVCVIRGTRCGRDSNINIDKMEQLLEGLIQIAAELQ